ncbi:MAG: S-layer homology domain-containing protein [Oscillospiraceae bacterium]|jgi:hypothetical protein|nr:S-layer homology domain-containing protein [Oscillospiraceae bacterium]
MKGRIASLALALIMIVCAFGNAALAADAPASWAVEDVNRSIAENITPQSLRSNYAQNITRAEFCALAVALYERVNGAIAGRSTFADTKDVNVEKAAYVGIVNGTNVELNLFTPNANLNREQAATMLARLAESIGKPFAKYSSTFSDNGQISSWAIEAAGLVQGAGIMGGVGNNTFAPKNPYTREQSIITIMRTYDVVKNSSSETTPSGNAPGGNAQDGNTPSGNTPGGEAPGQNTPGGNTPGEGPSGAAGAQVGLWSMRNDKNIELLFIKADTFASVKFSLSDYSHHMTAGKYTMAGGRLSLSGATYDGVPINNAVSFTIEATSNTLKLEGTSFARATEQELEALLASAQSGAGGKLTASPPSSGSDNAIAGNWMYAVGASNEFKYNEYSKIMFGFCSYFISYRFEKDGTYCRTQYHDNSTPGLFNGWFWETGKYRVSGNKIILEDILLTKADMNDSQNGFKDRRGTNKTLSFESLFNDKGQTVLRIQSYEDPPNITEVFTSNPNG